jgi:hypothetical protein
MSGGWSLTLGCVGGAVVAFLALSMQEPAGKHGWEPLCLGSVPGAILGVAFGVRVRVGWMLMGWSIAFVATLVGVRQPNILPAVVLVSILYGFGWTVGFAVGGYLSSVIRGRVPSD